jgi:Domain of unknown function (DUF1707)
MADNRWIRVSDQDRENAAELLIEAYAVGRVSREENLLLEIKGDV